MPRISRDVWPRAAAAVWIAAMLSVLAMGAFGSPGLRARLAEDGPGCPFRMATSVRCAFCGLTHATLALGHGDLPAAFGYHPLAPFLLLAMLAACAAIALGRGDALLVGARPYLILGVVAVVWAVNLLA